MRSSLPAALAALVLAGCALEHGNSPPARTGAGASPHASRDSAGSPLHAVFSRRPDTVASGVTRLVVSVVLQGAERTAARAAMEAVADDSRRDTTVAAVRVLAYLPPVPGHGDRGGPGLVPFAYLEWIPAGGWDDVSASTARSAHHTEVVFMQDLRTHPGREGPQ